MVMPKHQILKSPNLQIGCKESHSPSLGIALATASRPSWRSTSRVGWYTLHILVHNNWHLNKTVRYIQYISLAVVQGCFSTCFSSSIHLYKQCSYLTLWFVMESCRLVHLFRCKTESQYQPARQWALQERWCRTSWRDVILAWTQVWKTGWPVTFFGHSFGRVPKNQSSRETTSCAHMSPEKVWGCHDT